MTTPTPGSGKGRWAPKPPLFWGAFGLGFFREDTITIQHETFGPGDTLTMESTVFEIALPGLASGAGKHRASGTKPLRVLIADNREEATLIALTNRNACRLVRQAISLEKKSPMHLQAGHPYREPPPLPPGKRDVSAGSARYCSQTYRCRRIPRWNRPVRYSITLYVNWSSAFLLLVGVYKTGEKFYCINQPFFH